MFLFASTIFTILFFVLIVIGILFIVFSRKSNHKVLFLVLGIACIVAAVILLAVQASQIMQIGIIGGSDGPTSILISQ